MGRGPPVMIHSRRVALQSGHVLHQRPYRDTSLLVEALTPDFGRVGLVARGARGPRSRMRGLLQPFRPLLLSWAGGGDLSTLVGVEADGTMRVLQGVGLLSGFYVNELIVRLTTRHDPHPELYRSYSETLVALEHPGREEPVLRIFEKRLLQELGYGLLLDREALTEQAIEPDRLYRYRLEQGPVPAEQATSGDPAIHGRNLLALAREDAVLDAEGLREAKTLMRAAIARQLGERPLKSRDLFQGWPRHARGGSGHGG